MQARPSLWISLNESCRILDVSTEKFLRKMAAMVTSRKLPDSAPQYLRADVERMASEAIRRPGQP